MDVTVSPRTLGVGLVLSLVVFGVLIAIAGVGEFADRIAAIDALTLAAVVGVAAAGLVAMGLSFFVVTHRVGLGFGPAEAILLFTAVNMAHNLTPFGQAGGEPVGALIVSRRSDEPYESCLAAISAIDVINFAPAVVVFVGGGAYLAALEPSVPAQLRPVAAAFALAVAVVCLAIALIYRHPDRVRDLADGLLTRGDAVVDRVPGLSGLGPTELERRLAGYQGSLGAVGTDPRTIVLSATLSTAAFVAQGAALWLALAAVDVSIPLAVAVVIVPVSLLASVIPLPGGGGGVEAVQVLIVTVAFGAGVPPTITAVVLSRGVVFWLPVLVGATTAAAVFGTERPTR